MMSALAAARAARHSSVMGCGACGTALLAAATRRCAFHTRRFTMQWQKPQATDLRYGFEITMYISAR